MGVVGAAALGLVLGWISCLAARGTRGAFRISARAFAFAAAMFAGAAALTLLHVGLNGALAASIGFGAGSLTAAAVLGIRHAESPINRNGG